MRRSLIGLCCLWLASPALAQQTGGLPLMPQSSASGTLTSVNIIAGTNITESGACNSATSINCTLSASGGGTVTSVAETFTGGLISVGGSPITASGTLALTVAGNSGGVPYFSSASGWTSSAALLANALVIGGGAGAAPSTITTGSGVITALGNATNASGGLSTVDGSITTGHCLEWGPGVEDAGAACGSGGSITLTVGTTPTSGGASGQLMYDSGSVLQESTGVTASNSLLTVASTAAVAFAVGPNGATTPTLSVVDNVANQVTGLSVTGAATGGTTVLQATDSGTTANIELESKGAGNVAINGGSSSANTVIFQTNSATRLGISNDSFTFSPTTYNGASTFRFLYTPSADVTLTASTNAIISSFAGSGVTRQHSTGALTLQQDYLWTGTTDSFVGASAVTNGATATFGWKGCGTNATCANESAIYVPTQALTVTGAVTNSYAANLAAATGATNNYALLTTGATQHAGTVIMAGTSPTGTTGSCVASSFVGGTLAGTFSAAVCVAGTFILSALPAAPNGYACDAHDMTTPADTLNETAFSTTSVTFTATTVASDSVVWKCLAF